MADTKQNLQFRKVASMPQSGLTVGAIYFDKGTGTINVATSATAYDKFGWGVKDATWANQKLTLTKSTGEVVELDFTNVASASDLTTLTGRVGALETWEATAKGEISTLQSEMDAVEAKAAANEGKLAGVTDTVVKSIDAAVLVETNRAKGIEGGLDTRLQTLETKVNNDHEGRIADLEDKFTGEDSVASQIEDAVEAAESRIQAKLDNKVETSEYNQYKTTNDAAVGQISSDLSGEITARETLEGEFDNHVADNVRHITADERTAWNEAKADIDAFMASAEAGEAAIDTLKEIQNFLSSDDGTVQTLLDEVAENKAAIATLNGTEEGSVKKAAADAQAAAEATAKSYTDAREVEIKKYADQAEADAVATAAADAASKADAAKDAAIAAAATDAQTKANAAQAAAEATAAADATAKANQALADAKDYADAEIAKLDAEVTSDDKYATVKVTEVDGKLTDVEVTITPGEVSAGSADALVTAASVKSYVDAQVSGSWTWEEFN